MTDLKEINAGANLPGLATLTLDNKKFFNLSIFIESKNMA
jgi:hypothetical protein